MVYIPNPQAQGHCTKVIPILRHQFYAHFGPPTGTKITGSSGRAEPSPPGSTLDFRWAGLARPVLMIKKCLGKKKKLRGPFFAHQLFREETGNFFRKNCFLWIRGKTTAPHTPYTLLPPPWWHHQVCIETYGKKCGKNVANLHVTVV